MFMRSVGHDFGQDKTGWFIFALQSLRSQQEWSQWLGAKMICTLSNRVATVVTCTLIQVKYNLLFCLQSC